MRIVRHRYGYLSLLVVGIVVPVLVLIRRIYFGLDWYYENVSILQSMQTLSAFFALSGGVVLFIVGVCQTETGSVAPSERRFIPWLTCLLLSQGAVTALSSSLPVVDSRYMCMELVAQAMGACYGVLVWLPSSWGHSKNVRWLMPILATASALGVGFYLILWDWHFPSILVGSYYGPLYVAVNRITAVFLFCACVRFVILFRKYQRSSDLVFAQLLLLSGSSDLVFQRFHLWGPIWWTWHSIQFIALAVTFLYLFALFYTQEKRLQESEARFSLLASVVFEGVVMVENGIVKDTNRAFQSLTGYSENEILGRNLEYFFLAAPSWASTSTPVEAVLVTRQRKQIPVEIRSRTEISEQSRIYTVSDISLHKEHEAQLEKLASDLERSNQELENFAHLASHDLREPLRTISSFLHLLEKKHGQLLNEEAREFINYAADGAKRMQVLVNGLLNYAKARHETIRYGQVDSMTLVSEAMRDLQLSIQESGARVICESLPTVWGDPTQLRRVFENLIQNAIKYRSEEPLVISITSQNHGNYCRFEVADNGLGIPLSLQSKIFELFVRGPTGQQEGTGMGLAACKTIVERHGGNIGVATRAIRGAVFYFTIPLRADQSDHFSVTA